MSLEVTLLQLFLVAVALIVIAEYFKKIIRVSKRVIRSLEESKTPLSYFILTFFFAVTLRLFLELFSSPHHHLLLSFFTHFYAFYTTIALSYILLFYLATRTKILRIAKVVLPAFIVVNLVPFLDLILSMGKGYNLSYLWPGVHDDLVSRFFSFTGPLHPLYRTGISPGMKIEGIIVLIGCFIYFYIKNSSTAKSLFYTIMVYTLTFCYSIIPFILKAMMESVGFECVFSDQLFLNFYLVIIFIQAIPLTYLADKKIFKVLIQDIRSFRGAHYILMFILGIVLGIKVNGFVLDNVNVFYFILITISIITAGIYSSIRDNLEDYEFDRISSKGRAYIKSKINLGEYRKMSWPILFISLFYAAAVNFQTFFIILLGVGNFLLYSMPPLKLKRVTFFSKALISFNSLLLVMLGFTLITSQSVKEFPAIIVAFFLIGYTGIANFIDIKDYKGDKRAGVKTLPVILGLKKAKLIISLFFLLAYISVYFVMKEFAVFPLYMIGPLTILGIIQFYLINRKKYNEKHIFMVYLTSLIALLIYLII